MFVVNSHEVFLGLTRDSRWSVTDFKRWLCDTLTQQLLDPAPLGSPAAVTAGLSFPRSATSGVWPPGDGCGESPSQRAPT